MRQQGKTSDPRGSAKALGALIAAEATKQGIAGVVFDRGVVRPVWFAWQQRTYRVQDVTMRWEVRQGRDVMLHLSVTDGTNLYELTFNQRTLTWRLVAVEPGTCE